MPSQLHLVAPEEPIVGQERLNRSNFQLSTLESRIRTIADMGPRAALRGRDRERVVLDELLATARGQKRSGVLVLRGEAGIGKTALLEYLVEHSGGCRIVRAVGVQSDMELAFASLQQLCGSLLGGLDRLPAPQRDALDVAFGMTTGPAPDRFLVGLAVLGLLSEAAADRPVVCVIDDAQWLDRTSAQVLGFVARRLVAESVALVFAVREPNEQRDLVALAELLIEGLADADARELLASVITGRVDSQVIDRIIAETGGNPLALLELPHSLSVVTLAGGFGVSAGALTARIEEACLIRLRLLPADTQQLLLVAATEPVGDPRLLWRAAEQIGLGVHAAAPAEADGLLDLGNRVRFRHPLVRSAIYGAATLEDRQRAHRALAEATDPRVDPDRRAWHRAQATIGYDEDVAGELERSADRAMARGGLAGAAAFLEQAAALTPESGARARRALAAVRAKEQAGAPQAALTLLAGVESWPLDELQRATLDRLRGQIAVHLRRNGDAGPLLLKAARQLESLDLRLARETYLEALYAANVSGRLGNGLQLEVARAVREAPRLPPPQPATDMLLDGLALRFTEGYAAGAPSLKRALSALRDQPIHGDQGVRWLSLALRSAADLFDSETWHELATRQVQTAHDTGALSVLPLALVNLAHLRIFAGEFDAAAALMVQADAIADATGNAPFANSIRVRLATYQDELGASTLIEGARNEATARGDGVFLTYLEYASAVLHNGLGLYDVALRCAQRASAQRHLSHSAWALPELVEAATRAGHVEVATAALQDLSVRAHASGTEWALGIEARARAMLAEGRVADDLYRVGIARLSGCRLELEVARARLVYGEWLRRERRRIEAREQLRAAYEMFAGMGAKSFAERTRRELLATGERVRRRTVDTTDSLTTQEQQVAGLARAGHSNQEIGGQLFISPKTVEYHLHKAFNKLGIRSRHQLDRALRRD